MKLLDQSLAKIAQQVPGATAIFNRHQLSFCCGGKKSLSEAIAEQNIDPQRLLAELDALLSEETPLEFWQQASDSELILHLLTRYHQRHREQLAELYRLAHRVEQVHGDSERCPVGLAAHLQQMTVELMQHMEKEESILFPMLAKGMGALMRAPMSVMRQEHESHQQEINTIHQLTNHLEIPKGACNTWRALYVSLGAFISDLQRHIVLENDVLFARHQIQ